MKSLRSPFLHLLLFACLPVITLYGHNIREVEFLGVIRPLIASIVFIFFIFLIALLIFRKRDASAIVASLIAILFFSYGHLQTGLLLSKSILVQLGRNWVLVPVYLLIFIFVILAVIKKWVELRFLTQLFNIVAMTLIIFPFIQMIGYLSISVRNSLQRDLPSVGNGAVVQSQNKPDIYYIVLDSYTRQDELLNLYGFDNSPFITDLKDLGFYIADCSFTNYPYTSGSMAATLNMDYLYNIADEPADSGDQDALYRLIQKNRVREILKSQGYKIVAFNTGITSNWLNWDDADVYFYDPMQYLTDPYLYPFESLFLDTTILRLPIRHDFINIPSNGEVSKSSEILLIARNDQELLSNLTSTTKIQGPKFVYFHILIPHEPFIFLPDGSIDIKNYVDENTGVMRAGVDREEGFVNNTQFINVQMLRIIGDIIGRSDPDPIIILQGDHAFSRENRYPILNAFFFPDRNYSKLYKTITPVNSFRLLFDHFFGMELPLLPDRSMWNKNNLPYSPRIREDLLPVCK